jgi:hypothetical protein
MKPLTPGSPPGKNNKRIAQHKIYQETTMPSNQKLFSKAFRGWRAAAMLLLPLVLAALACSFNTGSDQSLRSTDIAISIQQTLMASTATALEAGLAAPPATLAPPTAETQPEATLPPSPTPVVVTATPEPALPTDTPTVAISPTSPAPESIPVLDWGMQYWVPIPNGCKEKGVPCWKMNDDYHKHLGSADLILISKNPVLIDPSWPNPRLTFWHKYDFSRYATVELKIDSKWSVLMDLNGKSSSGRWVMDTIDLKDYRGKNIIIRYSAGGIWGSGGIAGSDWFVTDVNFVPDYQPAP